nr:gas vesicle structural protein GvpA [Actinomadura rayongensis]
MSVMTEARTTPNTSAGRRGSLYDVLELVLDRGLVIDVFVRVSLVGIELLTIDARIVVASVDTYLRFAEACNRLDLTNNGNATTLPELVGDVTEKGAHGKSKGALAGAVEAIGDTIRPSRDSGDDDKPRSTRSRRKEPAE